MESASYSAPKGMLHAPLITSKRLEATLGRIMNVGRGCIKSSEGGAQYPLAVLRASISLPAGPGRLLTYSIWGLSFDRTT